MGRRTGKRRVAEVVPPELKGVARLFLEHPVATLELHGLRAGPAESRVRGFLAGQARTTPGQVVQIITGKGNRSAGGPVLPSLTRELLEGDCAPFVSEFAAQPGGGGYMVRLARGGAA